MEDTGETGDAEGDTEDDMEGGDLSVVAHDDPEGHTIVEVTGDLNATTAPQLQLNLVRLIAADSFFLVVDLTGAGQLDVAAVVPMLADAADRVRPYRGWLRVVDPSGELAGQAGTSTTAASASVRTTPSTYATFATLSQALST
jgi:anti-anti-sigma regulatory factor